MTATAPEIPLRPALVELLPRGDLRAALGFAWRSIRASAHLTSHVPGVCFFALQKRDLVVRFMAARPEEHLVIGGDRACDVTLPGLARRQLLLRTVRLSDGVTAVRLIDLASRGEIRVADERRVGSLVASGPFAVDVGGVILGAMPFDATSYEIGSRGPVAPLVEHVYDLPRFSIPGPRGRRPRISCLPPPRALTEVREALYTQVARLELARGRHQASIGLDAETLTRGVMIGRVPRAGALRWRRLLGSNVSPDHLALFREGGRVIACDLRSERGTFAAGVPMRGAHLPRVPASLTLGRLDPTTLTISAGT